MSDYQLWTGTGNLVKAPVRHKVGETNSVCHFRLASSAKDAKDTLFIDVVCWGSIAEVCFKYLNKGDKVLIAGPLHNHEWTTEALVKRRSIEIHAQRVVFLRTAQRQGTNLEGEGNANAQT